MAKRQTQAIPPRVGGVAPSRGRIPVLGRRWFRVGPGLLLAVAASVWVWRQQSPPRPRGEQSPPRIERTRADNRAADAPLLSAPDPDWLLARQNTLGLNRTQDARLRALHARWQRDTQTLRAALARATAQFEQETAAARSGGTLEGLQERARPVSELSRQLADARRAWWDEAADVLIPAQRKQAEQAWARRFARPAAAPRQHNSDTAAHP